MPLPQPLLYPLLLLQLQLAWSWVALGAPQRKTSGRWGWNGWIPPPSRGWGGGGGCGSCGEARRHHGCMKSKGMAWE